MSFYANQLYGRQQVLKKMHYNKRKGRKALVMYFLNNKLVKFEWRYTNNFHTDRKFDK